MADNLTKFDHIVVLMLENRSFDHMLGSLAHPDHGRRTDVEGLTGNETNHLAGREYPVFHLSKADGNWFPEWEPDPSKWNPRRFQWDPGHQNSSVLNQLKDENGGFVRDFHKHFPSVYPGLIMGYYTAEDLPTYDYLAQEYLVCDHWFSSIEGPTMPNRVYALSGTTLGEVGMPRPPLFRQLKLYESLRTIFEVLDKHDVSWAYYFHDAAYLWTYKRYRKLLGHKNIRRIDEFEKALAEGNLPAVSWIDPDFNHALSHRGNDDHPPSDVRDGQRLVLDIYRAISNSDFRETTLFVITYDEHGGFYDHVRPPTAEDDWPDLRRYGVRVPAIVVSPFVKRGGVSSLHFDHTSIIKTILLKFCQGPNEGIQDWLSKRVKEAIDLSQLLTLESVRPKPAPPDADMFESDSFAGLMALPPVSIAEVESRFDEWDLDEEPIAAADKASELQEMLKALAEDRFENEGSSPTEEL